MRIKFVILSIVLFGMCCACSEKSHFDEPRPEITVILGLSGAGDNEYNTFVLTLETAFPLPLWVGINKDIRDNDLPFEDTDFRKSDPQIKEYNHTIQIVDYSKGDNDGWIKYKDPNRGNYEYTVNWNQFKQFANEKSLYLFSYKSANEVPQIISD